MKTCFENLVGLSKSECDCYTFDESLKQSSLGLFVDDLEAIDLQLLQSAIGCGDTLQKAFEKAYSSAVNFFESDLQVYISESHRQKYSPYVGRIGERKFDKALPLRS